MLKEIKENQQTPPKENTAETGNIKETIKDPSDELIEEVEGSKEEQSSFYKDFQKRQKQLEISKKAEFETNSQKEKKNSFLSKAKGVIFHIAFTLLVVFIMSLTYFVFSLILFFISDYNDYLLIVLLLVGSLMSAIIVLPAPIAYLFAKLFSLFSVNYKFANWLILFLAFAWGVDLTYSIWSDFSHELVRNSFFIALTKSIILSILAIGFSTSLYLHSIHRISLEADRSL